MTTSDNIILRAIEPDDIDLLYNVENDRTLWQLGNTNEPYSKELLRNYILSTTGDIYADKQLRLIIELQTKSSGVETNSLAEANNKSSEAKTISLAENNLAENETISLPETNLAAANLADNKTEKLADTNLKSVRSIIGIVDLTRFDPRNARAEVGIVILDRFRHQGFASQVLQRLSDYCKNLLHLHQLYAIIPATNTASLGLFDKCGYTRCATLRDWLHDGSSYEQALVVQKFL